MDPVKKPTGLSTRVITLNGGNGGPAQARIPLRRFDPPQEMAAAIPFLACPEASYITGSGLKVDGGIFLAWKTRTLLGNESRI
jgi:NAD(P)-dependent dehydrogenase (short-subunit alcohol dehydrogenase family)